MKYPFCAHDEDKVVDSRGAKGGEAIRRRRECLSCAKRYTTYEQIEDIQPMVVKKDGRREPFDRIKILGGLRKACEKRPIPSEKLEQVTEEIEKAVETRFEKEISSHDLGEIVMEKLYNLDEVAYVRFASVYRSFKDVHAFSEELKKFMSRLGKEGLN